MNKAEFLNDLISVYEECDEECEDCLLANYIDVFNKRYLICDIIQTTYQKGIQEYKKQNNLK